MNIPPNKKSSAGQPFDEGIGSPEMQEAPKPRHAGTPDITIKGAPGSDAGGTVDDKGDGLTDYQPFYLDQDKQKVRSELFYAFKQIWPPLTAEQIILQEAPDHNSVTFGFHTPQVPNMSNSYKIALAEVFCNSTNGSVIRVDHMLDINQFVFKSGGMREFAETVQWHIFRKNLSEALKKQHLDGVEFLRG